MWQDMLLCCAKGGNLAVLQGGLATFSNPLQGAIFGPMALSVLSVLYELHMASQMQPGSQPPSSRLARSQSHGNALPGLPYDGVLAAGGI